MQARNSLTVKVLEPLTRYKIDYDKEGFEMDLTWEAIGPATSSTPAIPASRRRPSSTSSSPAG